MSKTYTVTLTAKEMLAVRDALRTRTANTNLPYHLHSDSRVALKKVQEELDR